MMVRNPYSFGYIPVGSSLTGRSLEELAAEYVSALGGIGGRQRERDEISIPLPLIYLVATGGAEQKILRLRDERERSMPGEPVLLLAHPGNNSLPAALEVLARLQQDGKRGRILYLKGPQDAPGLQEVAEAAAGLRAFHELRRVRIGLVGPPSDWLMASSPDPEVVRQVWGPQVIPIPIDELVEAMAAIPEKAVEPLGGDLISKTAGVRETGAVEIGDAVRVYLALKRLVGEHQLQAVTVRCFDLVGDLKTTGCFALAQLNDEGIVAACEGDLVSATAMLWIRALLGQISWMANPARIDAENNSTWLAHCTVPRDLVEGYRLRSHFESGLGVGIQGTFSPGPVTLVRIGGRNMERLWLAEGEILRAGSEEQLCRTQAEVRLTRDGGVGELLTAPLGNHLVLTPGHHTDRLQAWWELMVDPRHVPPQSGKQARIS
jgi:L-fucose isomerase-like protein